MTICMFGTTKSKMWPGLFLITIIFVNLVQIKCSTCQEGEFSDDTNKPNNCQRCKQSCNPGLELIYSCNATTDNECVCAKANQFKDNVFGGCADCKLCPPGFYPEKPCTIETRCVKCPLNHFSNRKDNAFHKCYPCTECKLKYKNRCNETHNARCDDVVTSTKMASSSTDERTSQGPTEKMNNGEENKIFRTIVVPILAFILIFVLGLIVIFWKKKVFNKRCRQQRFLSVNEESEKEILNTGGLLLRHQPASLMFELNEYLSTNQGKNWEHLAGKFGFIYDEIANFKAEEKPAEAMLASWQTTSSSTVDRLHECLIKIGRQDVADYLADNIKMLESTV